MVHSAAWKCEKPINPTYKFSKFWKSCYLLPINLYGPIPITYKIFGQIPITYKNFGQIPITYKPLGPPPSTLLISGASLPLDSLFALSVTGCTRPLSC